LQSNGLLFKDLNKTASLMLMETGGVRWMSASTICLRKCPSKKKPV
jgi:hypothetical protein